MDPPKVAGRDFVMPWNITKEFWSLYDKPAEERPLYPFHAEPIDEFVKKYNGKRDVPIFDSKFVVPVIYINDAAEFLKEGSSFRRYLQETQVAVCDSDQLRRGELSEAEAQAAWNCSTVNCAISFSVGCPARASATFGTPRQRI